MPDNAEGGGHVVPKNDTLDYLISPNMLPRNCIHLFAGSPYAGKSTLLAQLLATFVDPSKNIFPELEFSQLPLEELGIILTDRSWAENSQWLKKNGLGAIAYYSISDDPESRGVILGKGDPNSEGAILLDHCIYQLRKKNPKVKVIVVDVFTNLFVGNNLQDQYKVYKHMMQIQWLCKKYNVTLLGTAYGSKQKTGQQDRYVRLVDRIIGAATLRGCATDLVYLATSEESGGQYQELHWVPRTGPPLKWALTRLPEGTYEVNTDVVLESTDIKEDSPYTGSTLDQAQNILPIVARFPEGISTSDLLMSCGLAKRTLQRYLKVLLESGQIEKLGHGLYKIRVADTPS